ncbi:MAG: hypothetical protein JNL28_15755 [Planctomycetes bacterium]|nr:hypothetical protein [Planctomycetota bacterium]
MKANALELELVTDGDAQCLAAPEVGWFTCALPRGAVVAPGESAGRILALGRAYELIVPEGALGEVVSDPPELIRKPVAFREVLYRLAPVGNVAKAKPVARIEAATKSSALAIRAPQSGRFYHRSAPSEPPFVTVGAEITEGRPVGMIEVMKTFSHVVYRATAGLPKTAKIARMVAKDGADVKTGDVLIELEPAG